MPATTNYNLWSAETGTDYDIPATTAAMQNSVEAALLEVHNYFIGTRAQRLALTAPKRKKGVRFFETDYDVEWRYDGTEWDTVNVITSAKVVRDTSVSVPTGGTYVKAIFGDATLTGGFTLGVNSLIVPYDGWYSFATTDRWAPRSTGNRTLRAYVNDEDVDMGVLVGNTGGSSTTTLLSGLLELGAGDELDFRHWQNSGDPLNNTNTSIRIVRITA